MIKKRISISINKKVNDILVDEFSNKSKYIEFLIYQDLLKNKKNKINKIIL